MTEETFTIERYIRLLSLMSTNDLVRLGNVLQMDLQRLSYEDSPDAETIAIMLMMLGREHELRQVEPLWRKAQRFAIRNSETFKDIGKIAACVGAGVILGQSLNIRKP